jgi:hypothetical protein
VAFSLYFDAVVGIIPLQHGYNHRSMTNFGNILLRVNLDKNEEMRNHVNPCVLLDLDSLPRESSPSYSKRILVNHIFL